MKKRRFLFFDLGEVLVEFDHDLMCQQLANLAETELVLVRDLILGRNEAKASDGGNIGDDGLMGAIDVGDLSQEQCYERFCEATNASPSLNEFLHAAGAIFSLRADMMPVVTQLVAAKQPIGILSNTCQPHWDYVCSQYVLFPDLFDVIVLSYEVRAAKPSRVIYETAAEMAGFAPEDIFFVDDRIENVEGARAVGFEAVQFRDPQQFLADLRKHDFTFNL